MWGGAPHLLLASSPRAPDAHKSLGTLIPSVDPGRAQEVSWTRECRDRWGEGRAGDAWKSHRLEGGQGGPETDLFLHQDRLLALPRDSSHVGLMWPVGELSKALTP